MDEGSVAYPETHWDPNNPDAHRNIGPVCSGELVTWILQAEGRNGIE